MHQAKGLEWAVFVLFVNEEMFPSKKTVEEQGDSEDDAYLCSCYKSRRPPLPLCTDGTPAARPEDQFLDPSRFIEEIPDEFLVEKRFFLGFREGKRADM